MVVDSYVPSFVWRNPTRIVYGPDSLDQLPDEIGQVAGSGAKVFLVTGRTFLRTSGLLQRIMDLLADFEVVLHDRADPFPTPADADDAATSCRESGASLVLGIGGGSALDLAKAGSNSGHSPQTSEGVLNSCRAIGAAQPALHSGAYNVRQQQ